MPTATKKPTTKKEANVPAVSAPPKEKTPEQVERERMENQMLDLIDDATSGDGDGPALVQLAIDLEREVAEVRSRIDDNRTLLRLMARNKRLSDAQTQFQHVFYPLKKKGDPSSQDELDATRILHEVARKS